MNISLNFNFGYKWYNEGSTFVKGFAFDENNKPMENEVLISRIKNIKNQHELINVLSRLNGTFSIITYLENKIIICVDITRTFPIFYYKDSDGKVYVSDNVEFFINNFNLEYDKESISEFSASGFVSSNFTLVKNVRQVEAGNIVFINENNIEIVDYYNYCFEKGKSFTEDYSFLESRFINIINNIANRIVNYANGRQIVVPLSGGYDSRFIVAILKKLKYENVLCFTYGRCDGYEAKTSQKIAQELGYKWYFIEYNTDVIPSNYVKLDEFQKYFKFASNYVSLAHMQDYFAFRELHYKKIIEKDAIVIPGHSGDFLGGSHLRAVKDNLFPNLIDSILSKHYVYSSDESLDFCKNKISKFINKYGCCINYSIYENFNFKERQSKFIVNSNRVYEFFGYKHMIPLWDREITDFFKILDIKYKTNRCLYDEVLFKNLFEPLNIEYRKPQDVRNGFLQVIKKYIKLIFPKSIISRISSIVLKENSWDLFILPILNDLNFIKGLKENKVFNYWAIKWYVSYLRK